MSEPSGSLSIVVIGASGDLASKKIFPAIFALFCQGLLPQRFQVFGFARSEFSDADFRTHVKKYLTCRYHPEEPPAQQEAEFCNRCHYVSGNYDSSDSFLDLYQKMRTVEHGNNSNRIFYFAIPPGIFLDVTHALGNAGLVQCGENEPWSRVVVEKPFGRDRESSDVLTHAMSQVFAEHQIYRIDHYLGKEVIQNLLVLRFANLVFEPIWNHRFIRRVEIVWKEDLNLEGRGGYFDDYGIIRDVMQNHLLQILALVAMDPPERLDATCIAAEKVRVLRSVPPVSLANLVLGQYGASTKDGEQLPGYLDDAKVPDDSRTPTFAAAKLEVGMPRWTGVPFLMTAGKGLDARMTEIRIRFREVPANMFCAIHECPEANELVIRVQPDESIGLSMVNKVPGTKLALQSTWLDLQYASTFSETIPDAYDSLLLDVIRGEKSLFIRHDELEAAWDIFSPVLHQIDDQQLVPESYPFGSRGPRSADELLG